MSIKRNLFPILRLTITLMTFGALLFNTFASALTPAWANTHAEPVEAAEVTPGLRAAIQAALGPDGFAPAEDAKLTASDGAAGDRFGYSVALSGDTALVGAPYDDITWIGSAYIFERDQGGADNWGQVKKLTASDGEASDRFGWSVAVSGDTALVGAYAESGYIGSAYIFDRDQGGADNWGEAAKITASDGAVDDNFGWSVAISGDTALVGAPYENENGYASGSAYILYRDQGGAGNWGEVKKLTASDGAVDDWYGWSVAISGDTALVGAYGNDDNGGESGSAYLYGRIHGGADDWGHITKFTASDGAENDWFGYAVALSEYTVLVGSPIDADNGADSGSAYLFERDLGGAAVWGQAAKITASDGAEGDWFGYAVAFSGNNALVGAFKDDDDGDDSGSAYLFERNQGGIENWGEVAKFTASDGAAGDEYGFAVAISGNTSLVGASYDADNGAWSGSAYIYSFNFLANGGFEDPLGAEWTEVVTGNGDGRIILNQAYAGNYVYLFKANGGLEIIKQTIAQSGNVGDEYTLTFFFGGKDVNLSGKLGARLVFKWGGFPVKKKTCVFTPPSSTFSWNVFTCTLTATDAFDSIEVLIGIQNVPSGMVGVDAAILNKTGP